MGIMGKTAEALEDLRAEMIADKSLPLQGQSVLVFGEGDPDAAALFVGEAPGFHEDRLGRPFVGRAGQLLDALLLEIHWPRESVYITNIVKRRPPDNRDPFPEEIEAYAPYLARQIEAINPKIIVALGRFAMNFFLPAAKISRDHGRVITAAGRLIVPLYHPAAALRSAAVGEELRENFRRLPKILREAPALLTQIPAEEAPGDPVRQSALF